MSSAPRCSRAAATARPDGRPAPCGLRIICGGPSSHLNVNMGAAPAGACANSLSRISRPRGQSERPPPQTWGRSGGSASRWETSSLAPTHPHWGREQAKGRPMPEGFELREWNEYVRLLVGGLR
jgi:hypothetical protein